MLSTILYGNWGRVLPNIPPDEVALRRRPLDYAVRFNVDDWMRSLKAVDERIAVGDLDHEAAEIVLRGALKVDLMALVKTKFFQMA